MATVKAVNTKAFFNSHLQDNSFAALLAPASPDGNKPAYAGPVGIPQIADIIQKFTASVEGDWQVKGKISATTAKKLAAWGEAWDVSKYSAVQTGKDGYDIGSFALAIFSAKNKRNVAIDSGMNGKYDNDVNNSNQFAGDFVLDEEECRASGLFDFSNFDKNNRRAFEGRGAQGAQEETSAPKSGNTPDCGAGELIKGSEQCRPETMRWTNGAQGRPLASSSREIKEFPNWRGHKF